MNVFTRISNRLKLYIERNTADSKRQAVLLHFYTYTVLCISSLVMAVINAITKNYNLMVSTILFAVVCFICLIILKKIADNGLLISRILFGIAIIALFTFFLISGAANGFSILWILLLPTAGVLLYGRKVGGILSLIMLLILVAFFWTPLRGYLQITYSDETILRFPILYIVFFIIGIFMEELRYFANDKLRKSEERFQELYMIDSLTQIHNRYGLDKVINNLNKRGATDGISLMIMDIDHFKDVNDTYGHDNGDIVLQFIASKLKDKFDSFAEPCRWGGEEFVVLFYNDGEVTHYAEEFRKLIEESKIHIPGRDISITISIGVANNINIPEISLQQLIKYADKNLYEAKDTGRNKVVSRTFRG